MIQHPNHYDDDDVKQGSLLLTTLSDGRDQVYR